MIFNSTGGGGIMMDVVVSPTLPAFAENRISILTDERVNAITMDAGQPENPQSGDIHILLADGPYTLTLGKGSKRITVRPKEVRYYDGERWWPCDAYIGQGGLWLQLSYSSLFASTGNYTEEQDDAYHYIKLLASGTLTSLKDEVVDVFMVSGGGGGAMGGGGGGYTKTFKGISISKKHPINVIIGAGGQGTTSGGAIAATDGGYSQFISDMYRADGGKRGLGISSSTANRHGGDGGSGGGGGVTVSYNTGGSGGADGSDGKKSGSSNGGVGQGATTCAFEEPDGELFAGGGAGWSDISSPPAQGGTGGGGNGGVSGGANGMPGLPNTGGGGGAGYVAGNGGSGIIIVRRAK